MATDEENLRVNLLGVHFREVLNGPCERLKGFISCLLILHFTPPLEKEEKAKLYSIEFNIL